MEMSDLLPESRPLAGAIVQPSTTCVRCSREFALASQLRHHFKTEHMAGGVVGAAACSSEDGDSSSSSCSSGTDTEEEEDTHTVAARQRFRNGALDLVLLAGSGGAWVYRALLLTSGNAALAAAVDDSRACAPLKPFVVSSDDVWRAGDTCGVLMLQSGFFSAAVFFLAPLPAAAADPKRWAGSARLLALEARVLQHRRCHRYTTRRKQGGSQSAHDASRGTKAKSAGAQLRRAGEISLLKDISGLLMDPEWVRALGACRRVVYAASSRAAGALFETPTLQRRDPRVFRAPMPTGRPSLAEATRVMETLAAVWPGDLEGAVEAAAAAAAAAATVRRPRKDAAAAAAASASAAPRSTPPAAALHDSGSSVAEAPGSECGSSGVEAPRSQRRHRARAKAAPAAQPPPATAAATTAAGAHAEEEADALAAAALAASEDRVALEGWLERLSDLQEAAADAEDAAARCAHRLSVPAEVLGAALGLAQVRASCKAAAATPPREQLRCSGAGGSASASADPMELAHAGVARVRGVAADVLALLGAGALPGEALMAVGLSDLAAAALVSSSGAFVDWSTVRLSHLSHHDGATAGCDSSSEDSDGAVGEAVVASSSTAAAARGRQKKGKKSQQRLAGRRGAKQSKAAAEPAAAKAASAAAPASATVPPLPAPAAAAPAVLAQRELMRRAAMSRFLATVMTGSGGVSDASATASSVAGAASASAGSAFPAQPLR